MSNNKPGESTPAQSPPDPQPNSSIPVSAQAHAAIREELSRRDKRIGLLEERLLCSEKAFNEAHDNATTLDRELQGAKSKHKNEIAAMKHELQEAFTASKVQGAAMFNIKKQIAIHENHLLVHKRNSASIARLTGSLKW